MLTSLGDKVKDVRISSRLKNNPVCLVADEGISLEMEKYLSQLPGDQQAKATKILEINPNHDIFKVLQKVYDKKPEQIDEYTDILYQQAMLIEGFKLDDPVAFSNKICELMKEANE
jgi:molecular chaperone HtpG